MRRWLSKLVVNGSPPIAISRGSKDCSGALPSSFNSPLGDFTQSAFLRLKANNLPTNYPQMRQENHLMSLSSGVFPHTPKRPCGITQRYYRKNSPKPQ